MVQYSALGPVLTTIITATTVRTESPDAHTPTFVVITSIKRGMIYGVDQHFVNVAECCPKKDSDVY